MKCRDVASIAVVEQDPQPTCVACCEANVVRWFDEKPTCETALCIGDEFRVSCEQIGCQKTR